MSPATIPFNERTTLSATARATIAAQFNATKGASLYPAINAEPQLLERLHETLLELETKRLQERICDIIPIELSVRFDTKLRTAVAQRSVASRGDLAPPRPIPWPLDTAFPSRLRILEWIAQVQAQRPQHYDHMDTMELFQRYTQILDMRISSVPLVHMLALIKRLFAVTQLRHVDLIEPNRPTPSYHTYIFTPGVRQSYTDKEQAMLAFIDTLVGMDQLL